MDGLRTRAKQQPRYSVLTCHVLLSFELSRNSIVVVIRYIFVLSRTVACALLNRHTSFVTFFVKMSHALLREVKKNDFFNLRSSGIFPSFKLLPVLLFMLSWESYEVICHTTVSFISWLSFKEGTH